VDDANELNLDKHHEKDANKSLKEALERVEGSLKETYRFLLAPMQDPDAEGGLSTVTWEDEALSLSGLNYDIAINNAVRDKEWVIKAWAPIHLRDLMQRCFWKDGHPDELAQKVWLDTCRYLYMPRLASSDVFTDAVGEGIKSDEWFGYAAAKDAKGYKGLLFGKMGNVYLDGNAVLLNAEVAAASIPAPQSSRKGGQPGSGIGGGGEGHTAGVPPTPWVEAPQRLRRFHGTVSLEAHDPIGAFAEVVQNVIEHFTAQFGTEVAITVDVEARRAEGFDARTVRNVKENATTLKFKTAEFEEE